LRDGFCEDAWPAPWTCRFRQLGQKTKRQPRSSELPLQKQGSALCELAFRIVLGIDHGLDPLARQFARHALAQMLESVRTCIARQGPWARRYLRKPAERIVVALGTEHAQSDKVAIPVRWKLESGFHCSPWSRGWTQEENAGHVMHGIDILDEQRMRKSRDKNKWAKEHVVC